MQSNWFKKFKIFQLDKIMNISVPKPESGIIISKIFQMFSPHWQLLNMINLVENPLYNSQNAKTENYDKNNFYISGQWKMKKSQ